MCKHACMHTNALHSTVGCRCSAKKILLICKSSGLCRLRVCVSVSVNCGQRRCLEGYFLQCLKLKVLYLIEICISYCSMGSSTSLWVMYGGSRARADKRTDEKIVTALQMPKQGILITWNLYTDIRNLAWHSSDEIYNKYDLLST